MSLHEKREIYGSLPSKWLFFKTYMPVLTSVGAIIDSPSSDQNYNSKWKLFELRRSRATYIGD